MIIDQRQEICLKWKPENSTSPVTHCTARDVMLPFMEKHWRASDILVPYALGENFHRPSYPAHCVWLKMIRRLHYFSELQLWARAVIWEACPPGVFSGHVHSTQLCIVCNIHSCAKDGVNGAHYTQLVCVLIIPVVQIIIARQVEERQKRESMMEIELGLLFLIFLEPESSSWNLNCTDGP